MQQSKENGEKYTKSYNFSCSPSVCVCVCVCARARLPSYDIQKRNCDIPRPRTVHPPTHPPTHPPRCEEVRRLQLVERACGRLMPHRGREHTERVNLREHAPRHRQ